MDELPELKSDADVDALMARLRAKVAASSPPPPSEASPTAHTDAGDGEAIEVELASVIARAMNVMAASLDELEAEVRSIALRAPKAQAPSHDRPRVTRDRRTRAARTPTTRARRKLR